MSSERQLTRRDFLRVAGGGLAFGVLTACAPAYAAGPEDPIEQQSQEEKGIPNIAESLLIAPGTVEPTLDSIRERWGDYPTEIEARQLPSRVKALYEDIVNNELSFADKTVDGIGMFVNHVAPFVYDGMDIGPSHSLMFANTFLDRQAKDQTDNSDNMAIKIFMHLPPELLVDGDVLDYRATHYNVNPYAKLPTPGTIGDIFEWVLLHEGSHTIQFRKIFGNECPALYDEENRLCQDLDSILLFMDSHMTNVFDGRVSEALGLVDSGETYLNMDEMGSKTFQKITENTTYIRDSRYPRFNVGYDDGNYSFVYNYVRQGWLPQELLSQTDLTELVQSGKFPGVYSLVNPEYERFADYYAWRKFCTRRGAGSQFSETFPVLDGFFEEVDAYTDNLDS